MFNFSQPPRTENVEFPNKNGESFIIQFQPVIGFFSTKMRKISRGEQKILLRVDESQSA
jgi:hypothetical protein